MLEEAPDVGTKSKVLRQLSLENLKDLDKKKTLGDRPWTISRIRNVPDEAPDAGAKSKVLRQLSLENLKDLDKKSRSQIKSELEKVNKKINESLEGSDNGAKRVESWIEAAIGPEKATWSSAFLDK